MANSKNNLLGQIVAVTCMFTYATAGECLIPTVDHCDTNEKTYQKGDVVGETNVCKPQGEGDWTWYYRPGSGTSFCIMDNACKVVAGGLLPAGQGPYTWKANFLPYVMTIDYAHGSGGTVKSGFKFYYGDGKFSSGNNHCGCTGRSNTNCKCGFPIGGKVHH